MNEQTKEQLIRLRDALGGFVSLDENHYWLDGYEQPQESEWRAWAGLVGFSKSGPTAKEAVDALLEAARGRLCELAQAKEQEAARLRQVAAGVQGTTRLPF